MALSGKQIWRDYTTDGVPSSGKHKPKKGEIRTWSAFVEANATASFDTVASFAASNVPSVPFIRTAGFYSAGDGGEAIYVRLPTTPSPIEAWHKQSADGAWWVLTVQDVITPLHFGATGTPGSDSTTAFAAMVKFAATFGTKMLLPGGGRVYEKNGRTLISDNMDLEIEAGATLKRTGSDGYVFVNGDGTRGGGYTGCKNFSLHGQGTINLNSAGPLTTAVLVFAHHDGLIFRDLFITGGYESHYFECNSSRNVLIDNVKFLDHAYTPGSGNHETVQIDYSNAAGFPAFGPYDNTACMNITVRNCYFGPGQSGVGSHSTPAASLHYNITVENCYFGSQAYYAIRPHGWKNSRVINNVIDAAGGRGILSWSCTDLEISGNSIIGGCTDFGIQVSWDGTVNPYAVKVRHNYINGVAGVGIYLSNGSDHSVHGNTLIDSGQEAIEVSASVVTGASIQNNKIVGASASGSGVYSAIRISGVGCSVKGNSVKRSAAANTYAYGIYFPTGALSNACDGNDVQAGTGSDVGDQSPATSLNSINGRVLLFAGNASAGNVSLAADITLFAALELQTGAVGSGLYSSGRAVPFATNRKFVVASDHVTVKTIQGKVDCTITNATTLAIVTANDAIRNIYGLAS